MAETLTESITQPDVRPKVVDDCVALVDSEVKNKGLIIRGAYKTVAKIKPGFVRGAVDGLLDDWLAKMESYYSEWKDKGEGSFGSFVSARKRDVADDLLKVTDERAEKTTHKTAGKMYNKLRPSALNHVEEAVPGLGELIDKYL